ncbi:Rossmann-fold NAD(P)-binding domain-containing protein, partial [Staphylococcus capitis]|uniref:hypothetical protein n=1 Tax=Staphylococcus capitis TaxID=29388 RepID=UPI001642A1FB
NLSNDTQNSLPTLLLTRRTGYLPAYLINHLQHQATKVTSLVTRQHIKHPHPKVQANLPTYFQTDKLEELIDKLELLL